MPQLLGLASVCAARAFHTNSKLPAFQPLKASTHGPTHNEAHLYFLSRPSVVAGESGRPTGPMSPA